MEYSGKDRLENSQEPTFDAIDIIDYCCNYLDDDCEPSNASPAVNSVPIGADFQSLLDNASKKQELICLKKPAAIWLCSSIR